MTLTLTPLDADPLRESVLLSQARRQERQAKKLRLQRERQRPTYLAGDGTVKPLGADGPVRLRGSLIAGGVPIGGPVAISQGLGMSQPAINGSAFDPSDLEESIRQIRSLLGGQIETTDPTTAADARFLGDKWLNTSTDALFVWTGTDWIEVSGGGGGGGVTIYNAGDPNEDGVTPISGFCFDTDALRMFVANNSDPEAAGIAWVPTSSKLFIEGEAAQTDNYYEGDFWHRSTRCLDVYDGAVWETVDTGCAEDPGPDGGEYP